MAWWEAWLIAIAFLLGLFALAWSITERGR